MSGAKLDQIVKGAPIPGTSVPAVVSRSPSPASQPDGASPRNHVFATPSDSLVALPSSTPQIYLNLLILEASLRSQYLTLRARRRQNIFFLLLLAAWLVGFSYLLFLRPREDGSGVGGSVYWVVETTEKVALMGGIVTGILIWGTGQWDRGVRWPRRWVGITNRGLRSVNAKIVVIKGPWWKEMLGNLSLLFPYSCFSISQGFPSHYVDPISEKQNSPNIRPATEDEDNRLWQEDLSPGGDFIKLLLLPKPFSPGFRENWELYRIDYWEKENERRARLRHVLHEHKRDVTRRRGGSLWWAGWRRNEKIPIASIKGDIEKSHHRHHEKGRRRQSFVRADSHSRTASRSSTPSNLDFEERPTSTRIRGCSTTTKFNERRRKAKPSVSTENVSVSKTTPISRPA